MKFFEIVAFLVSKNHSVQLLFNKNKHDFDLIKDIMIEKIKEAKDESTNFFMRYLKDEKFKNKIHYLCNIRNKDETVDVNEIEFLFSKEAKRRLYLFHKKQIGLWKKANAIDKVEIVSSRLLSQEIGNAMCENYDIAKKCEENKKFCEEFCKKIFIQSEKYLLEGNKK